MKNFGLGAPRSIDSTAKILVFASIFAILLLGLFSVRGLYADGSFFLYNILSAKSYWLYSKPRAFAQILIETPIVLGIKLGVTDLVRLIYLHTFGLVALPLIIWMLALAQHLKSDRFWTLLIAFSVTNFCSSFFAIGEYTVTYALAAFCISILLKDKISKPWLICVLAAAVILTRSYEAMVFLGPMLFALSGLRLLKLKTTPFEKFALVPAQILFATATAIAAWSILHPADPANLANALGFGHLIKSRQFKFLVIMIGLHLVVDWVPTKLRIGATSLAVVLATLTSIRPNRWINPVMNYELRSVCGLILFGISLALLVQKYFLKANSKGVRASKDYSRMITSLSLFLPLALMFSTYSLQFSKWLKTFETTATLTSTWINVDEVETLNKLGLDGRFDWPWTNPYLSLVLRGDGLGGIKNSRAHEEGQAFNPNFARENPLGEFTRGNGLQVYEY